jgi:hypothetical protein
MKRISSILSCWFLSTSAWFPVPLHLTRDIYRPCDVYFFQILKVHMDQDRFSEVYPWSPLVQRVPTANEIIKLEPFKLSYHLFAVIFIYTSELRFTPRCQLQFSSDHSLY